MAKKTNSGSVIGGWAFLVGVVLAVVLGALGSISPGVTWLLVFIGLVVGFLNVSVEESSHFLMSGAVMIIAAAFGGNSLGTIPIASSIFDALLAIFVPATIVVAVRNVFGIARH